MSYLVTISREGAPLEAAEVEAAFRADASLSVAGSPVRAAWRASPRAPEEHFVYDNGVVTATTPSDAALAKLQQLAAVLGARVRGEEGEDLTDVPLPPSAAGRGPGKLVVVVAAVLAGMVWLLLR